MAMCEHYSGLVFSVNKSFALEQNLGNHCDVTSYVNAKLALIYELLSRKIIVP